MVVLTSSRAASARRCKPGQGVESNCLGTAQRPAAHQHPGRRDSGVRSLGYCVVGVEISATSRDSLFGPAGANMVDWNLIETHFRDLMRVAISIRERRISSTMLMRRLSSNSRRNHIYQAFREVGKVIRTIQLLKHISDAPLRRRATAATNKVESYNGFAQWLQFSKHGVLAHNGSSNLVGV